VSVHTQVLAEEHEDLVDGNVCVAVCVCIYTHEFVTSAHICIRVRVINNLETEQASVHTQFLAEEHEDLVDGNVCVLQCVCMYIYISS